MAVGFRILAPSVARPLQHSDLNSLSVSFGILFRRIGILFRRIYTFISSFYIYILNIFSYFQFHLLPISPAISVSVSFLFPFCLHFYVCCCFYLLLLLFLLFSNLVSFFSSSLATPTPTPITMSVSLLSRRHQFSVA
jgi:hypothetical protein